LVGKAHKGHKGVVYLLLSLLLSKTFFNKNKRKTVKDKKHVLKKLSSKGQFQFFQRYNWSISSLSCRLTYRVSPFQCPVHTVIHVTLLRSAPSSSSSSCAPVVRPLRFAAVVMVLVVAMEGASKARTISAPLTREKRCGIEALNYLLQKKKKKKKKKKWILCYY
jgi:hypothetical protein